MSAALSASLERERVDLLSDQVKSLTRERDTAWEQLSQATVRAHDLAKGMRELADQADRLEAATRKRTYVV